MALDGQLDYLVSQRAETAASALNVRVHAYLRDTICLYPATGTFLPRRNLWESWIPGTRLVAWYTFDDRQVVVMTFWHTSQNRSRT
jgi:predicted deacetylase